MLIAALLWVVSGCGVSPSASSQADSSAEADALCPKLDLRMPNGDELDLQGTWRGSDLGEYYLSQAGSCVHFFGRSTQGEATGGFPPFAVIFSGRLGGDFSIQGEWADVPAPPVTYRGGNVGELQIALSFYTERGTMWPALHLVAHSGLWVPENQGWVREESLDPEAEFTGTYGFESDCPWLEVDGSRYSLVEWKFDIADAGQILGDGSTIIARPGDQLKVVAQVAPELRLADCQPSAMLVWDLEQVQ